MMHNRFLAKCGVSLACLVSVWGMGAYAKTTELFRFPVNIPAGTNGADGCSAKVTAGSNGCTEITERTRVNGACQDTSNVRTVCPGEQGNSCSIKSVSTVDNAQKVTFNCGDPDDDTEITIPHGQGCAVTRVDTTATGKNIIMACGNNFTTIPVENGTNCNLTVATDSTTRNVSVTKSCGNETPTTVQILNHQNLVNDAATATANKIIQDGTFTTPSDVESAIDGAITTAELKTKLDTEYANLTTTNAALAGKVDQDDFETYQSQVTNELSNKADADSVYDKAHIDTALASIESGTTPEHLQDLINQAVAGQYASKTEFDNLSDTVNGKLNKSDFVSELGKTQALNVINNAITSNSTVAGKASQSALDTLTGRVTANEAAIAALPNEERVSEIAAAAANAAALCTGTITTRETTTENGKTVEVLCTTDD